MSNNNNNNTRYRDTLLGVIIGTTLSTALTISYFRLQSRRQTQTNNNNNSQSNTKQPQTIHLPPEFRQEQLSRNALYFSNNMPSITSSRIIVVGIGGVGSHCAYMLARSGIQHLRLIDYDQVTLSSLNRHACATLSDVGLSKVQVLKNAITKICPDERYCTVDARNIMYTGSENDDLLEGDNWDFVMDCIDDIPTKAALLAECVTKNLRVVSCMGAGGKADPTRLHIGDLKSASRDPLASKLRQTLKKIGGNELIDSDLISVLFSSEKTVMPLADFTEEQVEKGVENFGVVKGMRVRVLPVLGTMPAIMGQACAAFALCEIGGKPFSPVAGERIGRQVRHRLFQHFKNREKKIRDAFESQSTTDDPNIPQIQNKQTWVGPVQIDMDDVEYLLSEVWRNRCAVTGDRLGTVLELVRWDLTKPSVCSNIVLMGSRALKRFDEEGRQESMSCETREKIERRLKSCRIDAMA